MSKKETKLEKNKTKSKKPKKPANLIITEPKKKKKKKKKKVSNHTGTAGTITRWEAITHDDLEVITFFNENTPILTVPFDEENISLLYHKLQTRFSEDITPDRWTMKEPLRVEKDVVVLRKGKRKKDTIIEDVNPKLTFTRNGRILSSMELHPKLLKSLHAALSKYMPAPKFSFQAIIDWWKNHKIQRVLLILTLLIIITFSILPTVI